MKIAHIHWSLSFGGIETMLVNIANAQCKLEHSVYIVVINDWVENSLLDCVDKRVKVIRINRKLKSKSLWWIVRLNFILHKIKPDAIHLHFSKLFGVLLWPGLSRVSCTTIHDLPNGSVRRSGIFRLCKITELYKSGNVSLIDKIPKVFAISQAVHDELLKNYGYESIVVNNGIISSKFLPKNIEEKNQVFKIIEVSRLVCDKKGQDLLIMALSKMHCPAEVYFVGEGESEDYLKKLTADLKLENKVHFLGKQTQDWIAKHLRDFDLFVQPSRYEGFGLTVAESMAANLPLLVSSGQGAAEVCKGEKFGNIFENGNVDDLVRKIENIINNYEVAFEKAMHAREYVYNTYDVRFTAEKYISEYKALNKFF